MNLLTVKLWQLLSLNLQTLLAVGRQGTVREQEVEGRGFPPGAHL